MAETPANLKQLLEQLEKADLAKLAETLKSVAGSADNANRAAAAFLKNLQAGIGEQKALATALKASYGGLVDDENRVSEAASTRLKALTLIKNSMDQQKKVNAELVKGVQALQKQQEALLKTNKQNTEESKKRLKLDNRGMDTAKKLQGTTKNLAGSTSSAASSLGFLAALVAPVKKGVADIAKSDVAATVTSVAGAFAATKIPGVKQFFGTIIGKAKALYLELSTVTTGFAKFTGQVIRGDNATKNLSGRLINLQKRSRMLGATIKNLSESMTTMAKSSRTYGMLMGTNRKQNTRLVDGLTEMSFRFSKVGLGAENFGKALDVIGNTYRRSDIIKQGKLLGAELVNIGRATGQSADSIANDFSAAMDHLAAYSLPKAREEFKKLSAISAVTSIEMGKVMSIAGQFDDIEATASAVGDLNAMMGGPYLNTLDMVNATDSERIEILKDMMAQSGETFDSIGGSAASNRFYKKAIAKALKTDVQTAARMFSAKQTDIDSTIKSIDTQGASYSQLSKAAKNASTSITEQLGSSVQSTLLMNKAFKATDSLMRNVHVQIAKVGDLIKETFGGVVVGTLNAANTKVNQLKRSFATFDGTLQSSFGILKKVGKELLALGFLGKEGFLMQMILEEGYKQEVQGKGESSVVGKPTSEAGAVEVEGGPKPQSGGAPPASVVDQQQALVQMRRQAVQQASRDSAALAKATTHFTAALQTINDKPININLNMDGQRIAQVVSGLGAQA